MTLEPRTYPPRSFGGNQGYNVETAERQESIHRSVALNDVATLFSGLSKQDISALTTEDVAKLLEIADAFKGWLSR